MSTQEADRHDEFTGRTAIVTGGASGIGAAVVRELAARGARVAIADLPQLRDDASDIVAAIGADRARYLEVDVLDEESIAAGFSEVEQAWATPDLLVTSAGVDSHPAINSRVALHDLTVEQWDFVIDVNLIGTFACCRLFAARASAAGLPATIVTLASLAARKPKGGVYAVSKSAVWMLTRVLAAELGPAGIRVNTVAPGLIDTPMLRRRTSMSGGVGETGRTPADYYASDIDGLALRRLGTVEEVAEVILFLSGDDSSYVTGSLVSPDGGFAMISGGG